jgi:hypothetical protein
MIVRWEQQAKAQRAEREAAIVADYRRRYPEATARDVIILLLAEMEHGQPTRPLRPADAPGLSGR